MGKVLVVYEKRMPERYHILMDIMKEYFEQAGLPVEIFDMEDGIEQDTYQEKLADTSWEYICTLDMAGFQIGTILGSPRYNIMRAKQIHIVINEKSFSLYQNTEFAFKRDSGGDKEKLLQILEMVRKDCTSI